MYINWFVNFEPLFAGMVRSESNNGVIFLYWGKLSGQNWHLVFYHCSECLNQKQKRCGQKFRSLEPHLNKVLYPHLIDITFQNDTVRYLLVNVNKSSFK